MADDRDEGARLARVGGDGSTVLWQAVFQARTLGEAETVAREMMALPSAAKADERAKAVEFTVLGEGEALVELDLGPGVDKTSVEGHRRNLEACVVTHGMVDRVLRSDPVEGGGLKLSVRGRLAKPLRDAFEEGVQRDLGIDTTVIIGNGEGRCSINF